MRHKLVALDIDGTLLNDRHELTEETKKAVRKVYQNGVIVALASGRGPSSVLPIMEEIGIEGPIITHNGAVIVESVDRKVWHEVGFGVEELSPVFDYCRKSDLHFDANSVYDVYVEHLDSTREQLYQTYFLRPIQLENITMLDKTVLKCTLMGRADQLDKAMEDLNAFSADYHVVRSGMEFIDIMHRDAVKGKALRTLCTKLDIPMKDVLAVGNYFNDLQMIRWAGTGVAVANAPEGVRDAADEVIPSNNDNGVARLLEGVTV